MLLLPMTSLTPFLAIGAPPPIYLAEGEQRLFTIPGLEKYSLGGEALRALPDPTGRSDQILIKAIREGTASIWVRKKNKTSEVRQVHVLPWKSVQKLDPLILALSSLEEVEIHALGPTVILRGTISTREEVSRVAGLLRSFPKQVHNETQVSEILLSQAEQQIRSWLETDPRLKALQVERSEGGVRIRGSLARTELYPEIERHALSLFPLIEMNLERLSDSSPTVYFRVFLLELKRDEFSALGMDWPGSISGGLQVSPSGVIAPNALDLTLNSLSAKGSAQILSNPELVVRAPGEAELFAGGELPIRTRTRNQTSVQWKPHGLILKLNVTQIAGTRIRLDISSEMSQLDVSAQYDEIPGIRSSRMKTQVDATFGEPLLLSGLLQESFRKNRSGLPFLKDLPVIGALFGSESYLNEQSELVAILLPSSRPPPGHLRLPASDHPKGPVPPPRNRLTPDEAQELRKSSDYPWSAF